MQHGAGGEVENGGALILVVDDHPENLETLSTRLEHLGYRVVRATCGNEALARSAGIPPDLILLDIMMPGMDGYEVARRLRARHGHAYIPVIFVTARDTTRDKVTGLDAGADDYLTKPINFPELEARVRSMLRIKRLQDGLAAKNRALEELSVRDGLTGLLNHRRLHELLDEELERSRRTGEPVTVVMFDLDRFKGVNDEFGHQAGDRVVRGVAGILRETAREIDRVGRYGGEEFLAILPGSDLEAGFAFAERVRKLVQASTFDIGAGRALAMTVSAGVATRPDGASADALRLVRHADQALYSAKHSGRNQVVRFDPAMADD